MFPFVDPGWYEKYWFSEPPQPRRSSLPRKLARFAVVVAVLAGGGVALSHFSANHDGSAFLNSEHE